MKPLLPRPHANVVSTEFEGGESVLVDLQTRRYYELNETATFIWRALAEGSAKAEIIGKLTAVYEVTSEDAEKSVDEVVEHLKSHRLLMD